MNKWKKGYTLCYLIELRSKCLSFFLSFPFSPLLEMLFLKLPFRRRWQAAPGASCPSSLQEQGNRAHPGIRASSSLWANKPSSLTWFFCVLQGTEPRKKKKKRNKTRRSFL